MSIIEKESAYNFICTTDKDTAFELEKAGYELFHYTSGVYTFLNCQRMTFDGKDGKLIYTNRISI
jgi:hypothetical protein|nr:MAG TPA: hypothetical protein [Caudoviricetes sp.]